MLSAVVEPSRKAAVNATKCVSLRYTSSKELLSLFQSFRSMCNDAIRVAIEAKPGTRFKLIELAYPTLKEYGLHSHYVLSACEVAFSVYKSANRKSIPHIKRAFLKLDNQSYRLFHQLLRIPTTPKNYLFLVLQVSDFHASYLEDPSLKRGSVTITTERVIVAISKKVDPPEPIGFVGIDLNERNVTVSATEGWHKRFDELGEVAEIKERYKEIRAKIARITRGDRRIAEGLLSKYGRRERNRTMSRLNKITKEIVDYAMEHRFGIKMEKLKGIRNLYRKGNGLSRSYHGRMNSWVFGETQRQVEYKARWEGVPVWYVNPRGTSSYCPDCGSRVVPLQGRKLYCQKCDRLWDRDDLASKNIMACAVPQARPSRGSGDGDRGVDGRNPERMEGSQSFWFGTGVGRT